MTYPKAYPDNVPGPFYVENNLCILCAAPAAVAPELVAINDEHCYFKKQPHTPAELEQAIRATEVCCCGAYRYRGNDPEVIRRLGSSVCDKPDK